MWNVHLNKTIPKYNCLSLSTALYNYTTSSVSFRFKPPHFVLLPTIFLGSFNIIAKYINF